MLTVAAAVAALIVVIAARAARSRLAGDVPVRTRVGDRMLTGDGQIGTVSELHGDVALLEIDTGHAIWVDRGSLRAPRGGAGTWTGGIDAPGVPRAHGPPIFDRLAAGGFGRIGAIVANGPKRVLVLAGALAIFGGVASGSLQSHLTSGGFTPDGEALQMRSVVSDRFGQPASTVVVLSSATPQEVEDRIAPLRRRIERIPLVTGVAKPIPSPDGARTMVAIGFSATENVRDPVNELERVLRRSKIPDMRITGPPVVFRDIATQTQEDLVRAEMIGMPIALIVLLIVFGTLPAAVLPLILGMVTVTVSMGVLRGIAGFGDLSIYILNIASMLGLSLGIDYSLLGVTRFREELARGADVREAVVHTVARAGVASAVSGVAVIIGLSGLLAFPVQFLRDIAIAGMVVVAVAVIGTTFLLPALLAVVGHRIERFPVRRVRAGVDDDAGSASMWMRIANGVMRHPILAILIGVTVLSVLASSLGGARFGVPWAGVLPTSAPSRVGDRALQAHFGEAAAPPTWLSVETADPAAIGAYVDAIGAVRGVALAQPVAREGSGTLIRVTNEAAYVGGVDGRRVVERIRGIDAPGEVHVGGQAAEEIALIDAMATNWMSMLGWVAMATFLVLLVAFRSVVLPLKAILLNIVSIGAAIGAVTHVFQGGHGVAMLGATRLDAIDVTLPAVLFAILFGLSMDYEVFMLARIAELYGDGDDNEVATARGLAWTAPLVTGAALILAVIGGAFATASIVIVKQIGFGLAVAIMLDATIVRCLLVPAAMRCFGDRNWWLPRSLSVYVPRVRWSH